jgi:dienelactone hydrolase
MRRAISTLAIASVSCGAPSTPSPRALSRDSTVPLRSPPPPLTATASPSPAEALGRSVVLELAAGEFEKVSARFDDRLKSLLPEPALRATWQRLLQRCGPFVALEGARSEQRGGQRVVFVTTRFARAELETRVVLDRAGSVSGLVIRPLGPNTDYEAPSYADPSRFSERDVRVPDPLKACASGGCGLPGTLAVPAGTGPFPALVLVHGSGPQDRDATLGTCRPFKDLAWGLASRGIVVLRYEKRTYFLEGRMSAAEIENLTLEQETVHDAVGAVQLLSGTLEVDRRRIFVLGHSQGGTALPRIARAQSSIAGFVSLAGSVRPLEDVVLEQVRYLAALDGREDDDERAAILRLETQVERVKALKPGVAVEASALPLGIPAKYWLDLALHAPLQEVAGETRPFLILQGERDYQVTLADFELWREALSSNSRARFKSYPKLNHAFIAGDRPSAPSEYMVAGHVAEEVVRDIAEFLAAPP